MRRTVVLLALGALTAPPADAQSWQAEVGIQGGFTRTKPAGTAQHDQRDAFEIPAFGGAALFVIVPWRAKVAVEPSFNIAQTSYSIGFTQAVLGLRADYALTPKIYVAGGGVLSYLEYLGTHESQLGLQVAAGYRLRLAPALNGRIEATWQTFHDSRVFGPSNAYSLWFGASTPTRRSSSARRPSNRAWDPMLGLQGGYARVHGVGGGTGDFAFVFFPSWGVGSYTGASPLASAVLPTPSALFAVIPVGGKLAIEPGVDLHRVKRLGQTLFSTSLSGRVDYAVSGHWYGAAGVSLIHLVARKGFFGDPDKGSTGAAGANLAWGYRFRFTNGVGGRLEASYIMIKNNTVFGQATNTMSIMFGGMVPL
jgi:hypothetical protein